MKFEFTQSETQTILNTLAAQPYKMVAPIIDKILRQGDAQNATEHSGSEQPNTQTDIEIES